MKKIVINLKKCIKFMSNCKKEIIILFLFGIITTIISIFIPALSANLISNIINLNFDHVIKFSISVLSLEIINIVLEIFISKNFLSFKKKYILNIRKEIFRSLINSDIEVYNKEYGSILNKIKDDSNRIVMFFNIFKKNFFSVLGNVGIFIIIFKINKLIGLYMIASMIISMIIRYYGIKKSIYYKNKTYGIDDKNTVLISEVITGGKEIKTLSLKDKFINKTDESFEKIGNLDYKGTSIYEYSKRIAKIIESLMFFGMILISIVLIKNNSLSIDNFIIIFMYKSNMFGVSENISELINYIRKFSLSSNRILSILEYKKEKFGNLKIDKLKGKIEFKDVSFSYEDKKIFEKLNVKFDENSFNIIVGKTGSGKTTLINLINRLYREKDGLIEIDNYNLNDLDETSIRKNISTINQNPYLFNMSIKENLEIIDDNFKKIKKVCSLVGIDEKINKLENRYDTEIGHDSYNLSGGEKQKIAIARTLLSNTKIILLDEITNNLDNESKRDIKKILDSIKGKYTIIMVTHDMDMITEDDRVIFMNEGKIIADGIHKEIVNDNKKYQDFYNANKIIK